MHTIVKMGMLIATFFGGQEAECQKAETAKPQSSPANYPYVTPDAVFTEQIPGGLTDRLVQSYSSNQECNVGCQSANANTTPARTATNPSSSNTCASPYASYPPAVKPPAPLQYAPPPAAVHYPATTTYPNAAYQAPPPPAAFNRVTPTSHGWCGTLNSPITSCPQSSCPTGGVTQTNCESPKQVLAFTASWCGPCQKVKPMISQLKTLGIDIREIDIDAHPGSAKRFEVKSIPTFVLFEAGEERERCVGTPNPKQIIAWIQQKQSAACEKQAEKGFQPGCCPAVNSASCCPCPLPPGVARIEPVWSAPCFATGCCVGNARTTGGCNGNCCPCPGPAVGGPAVGILVPFHHAPHHAPQPQIPGAVKTEVLVRAVYDVPREKAKALVELLKLHSPNVTIDAELTSRRVAVKKPGVVIQTSSEAHIEMTETNRLTITTTPEAQHAIGIFIKTFMKAEKSQKKQANKAQIQYTPKY